MHQLPQPMPIFQHPLKEIFLVLLSAYALAFMFGNQLVDLTIVKPSKIFLGSPGYYKSSSKTLKHPSTPEA